MLFLSTNKSTLLVHRTLTHSHTLHTLPRTHTHPHTTHLANMRSFATAAFTLALAGASALAAPVANNNNLAARSQTGKATFFEPGLGACGWQSSASDHIAAIDSAQYAGGSNCGKWATVFHGDSSVRVKIVDECPTCPSSSSLDLSPAAFSALASQDLGEIDITWKMDD